MQRHTPTQATTDVQPLWSLAKIKSSQSNSVCNGPLWPLILNLLNLNLKWNLSFTADRTTHRASRVKHVMWQQFFLSYGISFIFLLITISTVYFTSKSSTLSSSELRLQRQGIIGSYYRPLITSDKWPLKWMFGSTMLNKLLETGLC